MQKNQLGRDLRITFLFFLAILMLFMVWSPPIMFFIGLLSIGHMYSKFYPEVFFPIASIVWILSIYYGIKVMKEDADEDSND